jgi:hypothetical protein
MNFFKELFLKGMHQAAHSLEGQVTRRIAFEIQRAQRRAMKLFISFLFAALGLLFLAIGAVYLFVEYLVFSKTVAFLSIGIVLLLIGVIFKLID